MDISNYEKRIEELENKQEENTVLTGDEEEELYLLNEVDHLTGSYDLAALQAWFDLGNDNFDNFEDAYQGKYYDDAEFVQQLIEETEEGMNDLPAYIHIDWEWTAREIMSDYEEENGYYFRTL